MVIIILAVVWVLVMVVFNIKQEPMSEVAATGLYINHVRAGLEG